LKPTKPLSELWKNTTTSLRCIHVVLELPRLSHIFKKAKEKLNLTNEEINAVLKFSGAISGSTQQRMMTPKLPE